MNSGSDVLWNSGRSFIVNFIVNQASMLIWYPGLHNLDVISPAVLMARMEIAAGVPWLVIFQSGSESASGIYRRTKG